MERVKRIAAHVDAGLPLVAEPTSAPLPVMENMKTKIAALAGEKSAFKNFLLKYHGESRPPLSVCLGGLLGLSAVQEWTHYGHTGSVGF